MAAAGALALFPALGTAEEWNRRIVPAVNLALALLLARLTGHFTAAGSNLVLGCFNLLPIPALDGGHILFLVISTVSEKLFGRKVPMKYEAAINMVFFALLMGLMLFVTFNDVRKLFS